VSRLEELVQKRAEQEALTSALRSHAYQILTCACWHHDAHGLERLRGRLEHMKRLANRLDDTLDDIGAIETAVLTR
jgi:hypothetical protein